MLEAFESLTRLVRAIVGDTRLLTLNPCTVEAQSGMTLDLTPEDPKLAGPGGLQGVPLKVGLPGFTVKVKRGARVFLGYEGGNEARPYAALFDADSVESVQYADGTQALARQGDLVTSGGVGLVVSFSSVAGLPVGAPPNNAVAVGIPYLMSFSAVPPTLATADPLYGSIATGRPEFTA